MNLRVDPYLTGIPISYLRVIVLVSSIITAVLFSWCADDWTLFAPLAFAFSFIYANVWYMLASDKVIAGLERRIGELENKVESLSRSRM